MNEDVTTVPFLHPWHKWTRWCKPETVEYETSAFVASAGSYVVYEGPATMTYSYQEQRRCCVVCGAEQMRRV